MTRLLPSLPSPRSLSAPEALVAMGRKVAQTFCNRLLTEVEEARIAQAYAEVHQAPRFLVHEDTDRHGVPRLFVVLDDRMWVVIQGVPQCLRLPGGALPYRLALTDPLPLVALYERSLTGDILLPEVEDIWFLTSFCKSAREMAHRWMEQDVSLAFSLAGLNDVHAPTLSWSKSVPSPYGKRLRMVKGLHRSAYQLRRIGAAIRPVREALDREVRRTLWSLGLPDGRLIRWLLQAPCPRTHVWRTQALRLHPVLLPRALLAPVAPDHEGLVVARATLTACIDAGQPAFQALAQALSHTLDDPNEMDFESRHKIAPDYPWSEAQVRFVMRHGGGRAMRRLSSQLNFLAHMAHRLHPQRAFKNDHQWQRFRPLARWAVGHLTPDQMEAFLKGCPTDWSDPFYDAMDHQLTVLKDALDWVNEPARSVLRHHLTLRQLFNLAERLHEVYQELEAELRRERYADQPDRWNSLAIQERQLLDACHWSPAGAQDAWSHQGHVVQELLSMQDTEEEGQRMRHCVGNGAYAEVAALGQCRLFSIRHQASGRSISTFELRLVQQKVVVRQHFGPKDRPPVAVAKDTLTAWLAARRCKKGPWESNPTFEYWYGLVSKSRSERYIVPGTPAQQRFRQRIQDEVRRRYPLLVESLPGEA